MKISSRERWIIGIGGAIVCLIVVLHLGSSRSFGSGRGGNSISASLARIHEYAGARQAIEKMSNELGVKIPAGSPGEQELAMRQQLTQLVQQNGVAISDLRRAEAGGRRGKGSKPIQFRLDLSGQFNSLMHLVYALEHAPTPFLVQEISVTPASGGGPSSGPPPGMSGAPGGSPGSPGGMPPNVPPGANISPEVMARMLSSRSRPGRGGPPQSGMPPGMTPGMPAGPSQPMASPPSGAPPMMGGGSPSGGGRPGQPGQPAKPGQVQATMLVQGHIFPAEEMSAAVRPKPSTQSSGTTSTQSRNTPTPAITSSQTQKNSGTATTATTAKQNEAATSAPQKRSH